MNARVWNVCSGQRPAARRGISLAEVAISSVLVGVMMVASLRAMGHSAWTQARYSQQGTGHFLGEGLMSEIMMQAYMEPGASASSIGREAGESATSRIHYDDVDDYHGYWESPPKLKDDTVLSEFEHWRREVEVAWVDPQNLDQTTGAESGVKRITVRVYHGTRLMHQADAFRTRVP